MAELGAGEFGRDSMPQARAPHHRMIAVLHLDGGHLGDGPGALDKGPGVVRARDAIGGRVRDKHPPSGELIHPVKTLATGARPRRARSALKSALASPSI